MADTDPFAAALSQSTKDPFAKAMEGAKTDPFASALGKAPGNPVEGFVKYAHQHPFEAFTNAISAPDRALQAVETGKNPASAFMDPNQGPALEKAVKDKIGLSALEAGPLAGSDWPHKFARGTADFALDAANSPLNLVPVGKIAEGIGKGIKAIPGAVDAGKALAESRLGEAVGNWFNPDHYIRGLTPEAKAQFEMATNRAMQSVRARKAAEDAIVAKNADAIRAGQMPQDVARLFSLDPKGSGAITGPQDAWRQAFIDAKTGKSTFGPGTKPQDVVAALYRHRAPQFQNQAQAQLGHVFQSPSSYTAPKSPFDLPAGITMNEKQARIADIQKRLMSNLEHKPEVDPSVLTSLAHKVVHRGNQAFLSNVVPHPLNLTSLAYNRYGPVTAAKGLVNAVRIASGKMGDKVQDVPGSELVHRFQSTPGALEVSPRGGSFFTSGSPAKSPIYGGAAKGLGGPNLVEGHAVYKNPLRLPSHIDISADAIAALRRPTKGIKTASNIAKPGLSNKNLARYAKAAGATPQEIATLLAMPDKQNAVGERIASMLAKKAGHDAIIRGNERFILDPSVLKKSSAPASKAVVPSKLSQNIGEMTRTGSHFQYAPLYDEMGITRVAGIPGTEGAAKAINKATIPMERAQNYLQEKGLNSVETGLRSAALDTLRKKGITGAEAARDLNAGFGSNAPTGFTRGAQKIAMPFAQFHLQTSPGSGLRTLVKSPNRLRVADVAQRDENRQINPGGPEYRSTTPTYSVARAIMNPEDYFTSLGPIAGLQSGFGMAKQIGQGHIFGPAGETAQAFIPGSQAAGAINQVRTGKKGRAGEDPLGDLISAIVSGYYVKK